MSLPIDKQTIRQQMRLVRKEISPQRRKMAQQAAFDFFSQHLSGCKYVLSFSSFLDEFDSQDINRLLMAQGKLVLTKIDGLDLHLYHLTDPSQLLLHPMGMLEPIPQYCREIDPRQISYALIPGIAFDTENHRIGYGKGFYDRLLSKFPIDTPKFGLGFQEQQLGYALPKDLWDITLNGLHLF